MNLPCPTTPTFVPALRALARSTRHSTRAALPRVFPRDLFTRRNARRGGRQRSRARDREREKNIVDRSLESDLFFKDFCTRLGWRGRRVEASTAVQREAASARDLSNTFRHGNKKRKGRGMKKKKKYYRLLPRSERRFQCTSTKLSFLRHAVLFAASTAATTTAAAATTTTGLRTVVLTGSSPLLSSQQHPR